MQGKTDRLIITITAYWKYAATQTIRVAGIL